MNLHFKEVSFINHSLSQGIIFVIVCRDLLGHSGDSQINLELLRFVCLIYSGCCTNPS